MKKIVYYMNFLLVMVGSACNDWLTVQPEAVIVADNLFTTNEGVRQALNGAYLQLRDIIYKPDGIIGGSGLTETLACTWTNTSMEGTRDYDLAKHVYTGEQVKDVLNGSFRNLYNVIANLNPLLEGLDKNRADLDSNVYNIVKGEALAIRASMHLELIRLWGPVPLRVDQGKAYLPYVRIHSTARYTYHSYHDYMDFLLADLNEAERLLKNSDPVLSESFESTETTTMDWPYRKSRFNYYGVLGLQARARLWLGDRENALKYAKMVKEAEDASGVPMLRLTNEEDDFPFDGTWNVWTDGTCYSEHLCGVNCENYDVEKGGWQTWRAMIFNMESDFSTKMFNDNSDDLRSKYLWIFERTGVMSYGYVLRKYRGFYNGTKSMMNYPVIRLSEMFLTIMECGTLEEANAAYEEFCTARGIEYIPFTENDRQERVKDEYLRELAGEGQNFFTYKRLNSRTMWFTSDLCSEEQYVLPIPEQELIGE